MTIATHPSRKMSVSVLDPVILAVGLRGPGPEPIAWLEKQVLAQPASTTTVLVQVVLPSLDTTHMVPEATRQAMVSFARSCQPRLRGAAFVLLFDGFLGATVRSVLSAAMLATRPAIPVKLFSTVPEGLSWLGRATPAKLPPFTQVTERVSLMAAELGVRAPL